MILSIDLLETEHAEKYKEYLKKRWELINISIGILLKALLFLSNATIIGFLAKVYGTKIPEGLMAISLIVTIINFFYFMAKIEEFTEKVGEIQKNKKEFFFAVEQSLKESIIKVS